MTAVNCHVEMLYPMVTITQTPLYQSSFFISNSIKQQVADDWSKTREIRSKKPDSLMDGAIRLTPDCFAHCLSFHDGLHELRMFLEKKFYTLFNQDTHWIYFHDPNIILGLPFFVGNLFSDLDIFWKKITLEFGNLRRICLGWSCFIV